MKNIQKVPTYSDPAFDAYKKSLENELTTYAELKGKQTGTENKPSNIGEFKVYILNKVEAKIQSGIDRLSKEYQPVAAMVESNQIEAEINQKVKNLEAENRDIEYKEQTLLYEAKCLRPPYLSKGAIVVLIGLSIIAISEGVLAFDPFRALALPWIIALIAAAGVMFAVALGIHYLAGFIRKAKSMLDIILRYVLVLGLYGAGFFALAHIRANYYNHVSNLQVGTDEVTVASSRHVSAIVIWIISFLMAWLALFLEVRFWKTKAERAQLDAYYEKCKELKAIQQKRLAIEGQIVELEAEKHAQMTHARQKFEFAIGCQNELKTMARSIVQTFIDKNTNYRTSPIPEFFSNPPEMTFKSFMDNSKKTNQ